MEHGADAQRQLDTPLENLWALVGAVGIHGQE